MSVTLRIRWECQHILDLKDLIPHSTLLSECSKDKYSRVFISTKSQISTSCLIVAPLRPDSKDRNAAVTQSSSLSEPRGFLILYINVMFIFTSEHLRMACHIMANRYRSLFIELSSEGQSSKEEREKT